MTVDPEKAAATFEFDGKNYQFCSKRCAERFAATPEKFLVTPGTAGMELVHGVTNAEPLARDRGVIEAGPAAKLAKYTCPMHPEIVRPGPGIVRFAAWRWSRAPSPRRKEDNPELRDMTRRFWISAGADRSAAGDRDGRHMLPGMPLAAAGSAGSPGSNSSGHAGRAVGRVRRFFSAAGRPLSIAPPTCSR